MALLEIKNIRKSFGHVEVLKGIDFTMEKGDVVAIIGSSGSGKTTLLRCINFLETPDHGKIILKGEELYDADKKDQYSERDIREKRLNFGMVFQNFNLFPHMTALENCMLAPQSVLKVSKNEAHERAVKFLNKVGMSHKMSHYPSQLSGGQQQRVAIARALCMTPQVLLLDEPTSALDPELVGEVEKSIADAAKSGQTMVLVSHDMSFVRQVADKVLFLEKGHILEQGTPDQLFNHPQEKRTEEFFASYKKTFI